MGETKWPSGKRLAFSIRDDDISYFTQPWMLETVYREAWRLGFKVSFAVIPFAKTTQMHHVPLKLRNDNRHLSLAENKELVDYLQEKLEKGQIDIVQHGYSHERIKGKPEFAVRNFALINEKMRKGNEFLRRTFGRNINVFTAPHDKISKAAMKSLIQNKISLCRKFTIGRFLLNIPLSRSNLRKIVGTFFHNPNPFGPIKKNVFAFESISIIQWDVFLLGREIEAQIEEAKNRFLRRLAMKEAFIIAHHHWEYFDDWKPEAIRSNRLRCFNEFLRFVESKDNNIWKATLNEIDLLVRESSSQLQS